MSTKVDESVAMASKVHLPNDSSTPKFKPCPLCSKDNGNRADHPVYKCTVYLTPKEKISRIKQSKGCLKCCNLDHNDSKCNFKLYKRCVNCSMWHFSFLCPNPSLSDSNSKQAKSSSNTNVSPKENGKTKKTIAASLLSEDGNNVKNTRSIVPTFCCTVPNGQKLRCLRDMGCQSNFIRSSVAESHKFKVLNKNVNLKVTGFNSSREYVAKIVEVPIVLGVNSYLVPAITIPNINISFKLHGLSNIAKAFESKGYVLADTELTKSDVVNNLDMVLGTRSAYCLKSSEVSFGRKNDSIYAQTDAGIMLLGDIDDISKNLPHLPDCLHSSINIDTVTSVSSNAVRTLEISSNSAIFDGLTVSDINDEVVTSAYFITMDESLEIDSAELERATTDVLERACVNNLKLDQSEEIETSTEENKNLMNWALNNCTRDADGRICLPLLWNARVKHLLGSNRKLAEAVLKSSMNKLNSEQLQMIDDTFNKQANTGIVERIENLDQYLCDNPSFSFLSHMPIFRPDHESTKVRVVFLSNLCEKSKFVKVSHNQAIHPGPPLNQKISTALIQLRFGKFLLTYDLVKAFNQVALPDSDSDKLLFLWYKDPMRGDFSLIGYRSVRLPFGLRCAPALLMLAMFKLLILDTQPDDADDQLKKLMYQLLYMDNGAICADNEAELRNMYCRLESIFSEYCFSVQQLHTNDNDLQSKIDLATGDSLANEVKLLGMLWDRNNDLLYSRPISLTSDANTKRKVLQTIAAQYDVHNFNAPLLNRSKIFLHKLQCDDSLGWDDVLPANLLNEWHNITSQANSSPVIKVQRFVGSRNSSYRLVAYTDASTQMYGTVIYIQCLDSNQISDGEM